MSGTDVARDQACIAIAVATRRRPDGLARLLASLSKLEIPDSCTIEVVIVENDDPHARPLPPCALPVRRVFEPTQGIPVARNRAIDEVAPTADWIVFLDDDETVEPSLVARLFFASRATNAPIATGPALPRFESGSPAWAARSGAYEPVRHAHLARVPYAFTNNVLFDARLVRGAPLLHCRLARLQRRVPVALRARVLCVPRLCALRVVVVQRAHQVLLALVRAPKVLRAGAQAPRQRQRKTLRQTRAAESTTPACRPRWGLSNWCTRPPELRALASMGSGELSSPLQTPHCY
jgi:hypothetical protein